MNDFFKDYVAVLNKYTVVTGRAGRKEYWMFALVNFIIIVAANLLGAILHTGLFGLLVFVYDVAVLIPSICVSIRRLHDTGKSGWWLLISLIPFLGGIILLVFMVLDSQPGANQYGPNPKGMAAPTMTPPTQMPPTMPQA